MLSARTQVKSHMTMLPYTAIERASGHIRSILSSGDVVGSPITATMAFTTVKFHDQNPRLYTAIAAAYEDAENFINEHPNQAAEIYNRHEPQKGGVPSILKMMDKTQPDQLTFTTTPHGVKAFADFMAKEGLIKQSAPSWSDFFFGNLQGKAGS
jgi:NitT/TauT family transport system substrate-binding protein